MAELIYEFLNRQRVVKPNIIGREILPIRSKMILGGHSKTNKSWIALNMAIDLAKGKPLFGAHYPNGTPVFPVTKSWKVLYIEQEIGDQGLRNRVMGMIGGDTSKLIVPLSVKSKDLAIQLDHPAGITALEAEIVDKEPDVVILDPLSKFHSSDEKDNTAMGKILRACDQLIQKYGVSLIIVHHFGLAALDPENGRRGLNKLRGASMLGADVDTFCEVQRLSGSNIAEPLMSLNFELRQGAPIIPVHVKRMRSGWIEYIGEVPGV